MILVEVVQWRTFSASMLNRWRYEFPGRSQGRICGISKLERKTVSRCCRDLNEAEGWCCLRLGLTLIGPCRRRSFSRCIETAMLCQKKRCILMVTLFELALSITILKLGVVDSNRILKRIFVNHTIILQ